MVGIAADTPADTVTEHGHSHGGHSHGPVALPVQADEPLDQSSDAVVVRRKRADSIDSLYQHPAETRAQIIETAHNLSQSVDETSFLSKSPRDHTGRHPSISRRNYGSVSRTRQSVSKNVKVPNPGSNETIPPPSTSTEGSSAGTSTAVDDTAVNTPTNDVVKAHDHDHDHADSADAAERGGNHAGHNHGAAGGHGSHGSMNMHGVFLHVLGDALGNVGVIAAGLVIWL